MSTENIPKDSQRKERVEIKESTVNRVNTHKNTIDNKITKGIISAIDKIDEDHNIYTILVPGMIEVPEELYSIRINSKINNGLSRPYSPISTRAGEIKCLIKIYKETSSNPMLTPEISKWKVNDEISLLWYVKKQSINDIIAKDTIVFISAGTGITPMLQLTDYLYNHQDKQNKIVSIAYNTKKYLLTESIRRLYNRLPVEYKVRTENNQESTTEIGIQSEIESVIKEEGIDAKEAVFIVCGPDGFVEKTAGPRHGVFGGALKSIGISEDSCFKC
ncbi:cytochrome-b5 reductase [Nematocida sp. AWRm80]|nr:cytochrome-b5 reductase [Nematocida sp. AWRm80]